MNKGKVRVAYTWSEIGSMAKASFKECTIGAAKSLLKALILILRGFFKLLWIVILLLANLSISCFLCIKNGIKHHPVTSVIIVAAVGTATTIGTYAQMKAKLNTAEHDRDMKSLRLDSVMEVRNVTKTYSRLME